MCPVFAAEENLKISISDFDGARRGDARSRETLAQQLRPRLEKMAHFYARCTGEDADDLLQEAWLAVWEALPKLDVSIGAPDQFLIQHARWRVLDCLKRARLRRHASLEDAGADEESTFEHILAHGALNDGLEAASVRDFCARLNVTQQRIVECLLRGLTWRETGCVLGCTSANIAYHMRQIRRHYQCWGCEAKGETNQ